LKSKDFSAQMGCFRAKMCGHTTGDRSLASAWIHEVLVGNGAGWGSPPLLARRLGKLDFLVAQSGRPIARQAAKPFVFKG
jgi:hypothetical protein